MKKRKFAELTDEEVREVVSDIFKPERISCIKRSKRDDEIICKIYTRWDGGEDEPDSFLACDELTMRNPFQYGVSAIELTPPPNEFGWFLVPSL